MGDRLPRTTGVLGDPRGRRVDRKKLRLLVVESDVNDLPALVTALKHLAYEVTGSTTLGEEALRLARQAHPDVVLMAIDLAGKMDGIEAATHLWRELGLPVIFVTSQIDGATLLRASSAEPYGYIVKPFDEPSLRANIEVAYFRRTAEKEREAAGREETRASRLALENERLHELNKMRAQFVSMASHELNTPLTPIRINLELLGQSLEGRLSRREQLLLESVDRNFRRLGALVRDLLEAARLQADRLTLELRRVDVTEVVGSIAQTFENRAEAGQYDFQVRLEPCVGMADGGRLAQIITNLLDNAFKFTPAGGRIGLDLTTEHDTATVVVTDNGRGIDANRANLLFQPFSMVAEANDPTGHGTGLGLYISRGIAELHGGTLVCESPGLGKGAKFVLRLPVGTLAEA